MAMMFCARHCCTNLYSLRRLQPVLAAVFALAIVSTSFGNLIVDTLRYDGHVRSGATVGNEAHFTNVDLLPNSAGTLPADNSVLPAPLLAGFNLNTTLTEALDVFNGMSARHAIITISATQSLPNNPLGKSFSNTLDSTLALPVQFEAVVYSDSLPAGQSLNFKGASIENFNLPPFSPSISQVITSAGNPALPLGSQGNPMRIQLGISADQVDNMRYGFAKVHLFYGTGEAQVPEPAAAMLLLLGCIGVAGTYRSQRSAT